MIYLDYSATTPVDERVLEVYEKATRHYVGNPNSHHRLGREAKAAIDATMADIKDLLHLPAASEVIFTSGASESNNLAIKGVIERNNRPGIRVITTAYEHPSVIAPLNYLARKGVYVDLVKTDAHGRVDLQDLARLLTPDTVLVTIGAVNSEIGIIQPIAEIADLVHRSSQAVFHSDVTQAIGKMAVDFSGLDLASFSAHKFYGLKGIGVLVRGQHILLETQVHGGHSTSKFRSGTPATGLILSLGAALRYGLDGAAQKQAHIAHLNTFAREKLSAIPGLVFNSSADDCLPAILNVSLPGYPSLKTVDYLEKNDIYVSSNTACASALGKSLAVLALTHDEKQAHSCIRISLSYCTTESEISALVMALKAMVDGR